MKQSTEKSFSLLIKIIVPFLIVSGFLKQYAYFMFFNVNISDFLTLNEILTSFLDDILVFIIIPIFMLPLIFESTSFDKEILTTDESEKKSHTYFPINFYQSIRYTLQFSILIYFSIKILSQPLQPLPNGLSGIIILLPVVCISLLNLYFIKLLTKNEYFRKNYVQGLLSYFLSVYLVFIIFSTTYEIVLNKYYGENIKVTVNLKDKGIITTSNNNYIGKTNEYIFIYDRVNKSTAVYPMKAVECISF